MNEAPKRRKWKHWVLVAAAVVVALPVAVVAVLWSGAADATVRRAVVSELARMTGGRVALQRFHFDPWRLRVTLDNLTIHGREPSGTPPFFHAQRLQVDLRVDSLWKRQISLGDVEVLRPEVHVRVEADGSTNVPAPATPRSPSATPLRQRLFALVVRRLRLVDGNMLFNNVRIPLVAQGGRFELALDYSDAQGRRRYLGDLRWQQMELVARRYLPFPSDVSVRFTLEPDSFSVTQFVWRLPRSSVDAQVQVAGFVHPVWSFRYRGRLDLQDLRTILRKPNSPTGQVDFNGNGKFTGGKLALSGGYAAEAITMSLQWFHTGGMVSRGSYHTDGRTLEVPDFTARAMGGMVNGKVHLDFHGLKFHVDAHAQGVSLASLLAAVNNPHMPVEPLHWGGAVDIRAVTTWTADFKDVDSRGISIWAPPLVVQPGMVPATARLDYHYNMGSRSVSLTSSEISTPSSRIQMNGVLGARDSSIEAIFDSQDLRPWDDFINRLRGADAEHQIIGGRFHWKGTLSGPIDGPTFAGHVAGSDARYGDLYWDEIEGDMSYSPDGFRLTQGRARRRDSSAQIELSLTLDDWNFGPDNPWNFDATLSRTETGGLQALLGSSFPVHGLLSGTFHGSGTRAKPEFRGLFDVMAPEAWGWRFDRARGEIELNRNELRIYNAELRLLPPPSSGGAKTPLAPGMLTGNFLYRMADHQTEFHLTGAVLPLEGIRQIQTARLPVGGKLSFQVNGEGALTSPRMQGSLRLVDLRLGSDVVGSFDGRLNSDGTRLTLQVDSAMSTGSLHGRLQVGLNDDYPITGSGSIAQLDLNALISSALHLSALTGKSQVNGQFTLSGELLRPETLVVEGNISHIAFDYQYVKLENVGPVQFAYRRDEIRVQQANLRGVDSDFHITGFARFAGDRALDLRVAGTVNLRLFGGFVPDLDARGPAQIDAGIGGSISTPRITGRVHVQNASLRYGDFPAGLSQVTGDFVFDTSRLVFDNITAETGGGKLQLSGSLSYSGGAPRYDITARSTQVRIRYPVGMSWLAGGTLRLSGTAQSGLLSGRVTVDRLLMSEGFDLASLLVSSNEPVRAPSTTSAFLRNLQLDVQADSSPNARLEWPNGRFQVEASLRARGTWDRPILLGNIHLLSGEMQFRGNRYQLTRGDLNFVNPFRLDPVINLEATTTIRQYEVTLDFSGPASHLTMSYRSDPPLPSSDIVALLALGQTGEESQLRGPTAVRTPEMGATTLLSEAISSQLGGRVQRLFGISHFSVDPFLAGTTAGQNTAARVTIEQQFSRNLTITYITNVTSTQQQVIQIEYTVRRDISIVALRDENGTFGIDVVFKKRFK